MKWLFIIPAVLIYYTDFSELANHPELIKGLAIIIFVSLAGIFFTAWFNEVKRNFKIEKRIENNSYDWSLFE